MKTLIYAFIAGAIIVASCCDNGFKITVNEKTYKFVIGD